MEQLDSPVQLGSLDLPEHLEALDSLVLRELQDSLDLLDSLVVLARLEDLVDLDLLENGVCYSFCTTCKQCINDLSFLALMKSLLNNNITAKFENEW